MPEKRWIKISEAADYLSISVKTAYAMAARGDIPSAKVGRNRRVDLRTLEEKLMAQVGEKK